MVGPGGPCPSARSQRLDLDGTVGVRGDGLEDTGTETQETERAVDGGVSFAVGDHADEVARR